MLTEGSAEYGLPITGTGTLRIRPRLRERYLTESVEDCVVQASGTHLRIWIWSDRDNVCIAVPFDGFRVERCYERSIHRWGVNVSRWLTPGKSDNEKIGWFNDACLDTAVMADGDTTGVRATVSTHDVGDPR